MICSKIGKNDDRTLLLDTSVLINLHSSKFGVKIIQAISNRILITENVEIELNHDKSHKSGSYSFLKRLKDSSHIAVLTMNDSEYDFYSGLTVNSSGRTVDSGEASIISIAKFRYTKGSCIAVMDDKKGMDFAIHYLFEENVGTSIDLLFHPAVISTLGDSNVTEALYSALKIGRMRVPEELCDEVIGRIGIERAKECNSLPGYARRFGGEFRNVIRENKK